MAALTQDRQTPAKFIQRYKSIPVAANARIFRGAIVAVNAAGFAVPAADAVGLIIAGAGGRAEDFVDNTGGANGAKSVRVSVGVFKYATTTLTQAEVGDTAVALDDQTVTTVAAATNDIAVGKLEQVEPDGVWIALF